MRIDIVSGHDHPDEVVRLFSEYTRMLVENDPSFQAYLDIQHYEDEIRNLSMKYAPPSGRLYLARADGMPAGCIALRRLAEHACEMKRLYVRPVFRGLGIGSMLVGRVIEDARAASYSHMLLDTLPFLGAAIRLYRARGFYEIPCYNDSPVKTTIFMRLDLR